MKTRAQRVYEAAVAGAEMPNPLYAEIEALRAQVAQMRDALEVVREYELKSIHRHMVDEALGINGQ